jgi:hypothetical protein
VKIKPYQACRTSEGWTPVTIASESGPGSYKVLVAPWGHPRENICECPGYVYGGKCKHQEQAMDVVCGWTELQIGDFKQNSEQRKKKICPRCSGSTFWRMEVDEDE